MTQLAALRRLAGVLGAHFLEEEGDDLVATVRRVADERGSTYIFVGTPDESRRREILRGSLLSAHGARAARARHPRRREPRRPGRLLDDRRCHRARRSWRSSLGAALVVRSGFRLRSAARRRVGGSSSRSPAARSIRPCSTRRSGSRAPRTRRSSPPTSCIVPLALRRGLAAARRGRGRDAAARGGRARGAARRRPRRRAHREGPHADARAAPAVGGRAVRPDRRPGAERSQRRVHREGPGLDPRRTRPPRRSCSSRPGTAVRTASSTQPEYRFPR